jgi:hypothetical protein
MYAVYILVRPGYYRRMCVCSVDLALSRTIALLDQGEDAHYEKIS